MAERVSHHPNPPHPHASDLPNPPPPRLHDPSLSQLGLVFESGTYVVQVPRDQIYRVPPPENARIVHQHQNPEEKKRISYCSCRRCCFCCFVIIFICAIALGISLGLSFGLGKLKKPEFQVRHFAVKNTSSHSNQSRRDYNLILMVRNPNSKSDIEYKDGGIASLFFRESKLGQAKFPAFVQDDNNSTEIEILLKGLNVSLPEKMKKSLKDSNSKAHVSFSLMVNLPTKMRKEINLSISCNFAVDTLARGTRVTNQKCVTN